jgi:hypothetical protein
LGKRFLLMKRFIECTQVALTAFGIVSFVGLTTSEAQKPPPALVGSIDFEDSTASKDPYGVSQDKAVATFEELQSLAQSKGNYKTINLSTGTLGYLAGVYLFCSVSKGTCPVVLDALLEVDYLNSLHKGAPDCSVLKGFWKQWIANDMEKRHDYLVNTGYIATTQSFRRDQRPRYIRCEETVASLLKAHPNTSKRYDSQATTFAELVRLLKSVKEHIPNIFTKMGVSAGKPTT